MINKKLAVLLTVLLTVCCLLGLASCKSPCKHENLREEALIKPTCTATGVNAVYCNDCGNLVKKETVNALGHDYSVLLDETNPTCTAQGTKTYKCSRCELTNSVSSAVDPSAHDFGDWTAETKPTLNNDGVFKRVCSINSQHSETQPIPSLSDESAYSVTVLREATCEHVGLKVYSSKTYGEYQAEIPRLEHTFDPDNETLCAVCNQKYYSAGLKYDLSEDGTYYTVSAGALNEPNAVIPAVYGGKPVKAIASEGFAYKTWLKSVTIPEYVENIGSGAFNGSGITKVYFNAIRCNDFKSKNWVFLVSGNVEVVIGRNVERIPARMFYPLITTDRTVKVTKLTFEEGSVCKTVGDYAFNKTSISSLVLPNSVEAIGEYAFYNTQITSLVLGNGVKTLGGGCFGANSNLKKVIFGKNLQVIPDDCFNYCGELLAADMSATKVISIGDDAFKGCAKLATVKLPDTCLSVGKQAFYGCSALTSLGLGDGMQSVGEQAFANCVSLSSLTLPASVKTLNSGAFENCQGLTEIRFNAANCNDLISSNRVFADIGANGKLKVIFGDTVERIPARLFYCSANIGQIPQIELLQIGSSVNEIGDYAFMGVNIGSAAYSGFQWNSVIIGSGNSALTDAVK